ncbi:hypothetical protein COV11_03570 [Candidatus Woesearchaeota archaeon CG10_big_fil_rev_8_21_14_0_10_30_7]|nr:MAG: hypothetical protein COV11_03570 [Candidatus Woesearchaeota archaeon CG10_big_fil_rev_8_21_14_0_10_30_7]
MNKIISASELDETSLKQLNKVYVNSWEKVLQKEHPEFDKEQITKKQYELLEQRIKIFPEGQLAFVDEQIIGGVNSFIFNGSINEVIEQYDLATSAGTFKNHQSNGELLICSAIYISPGHKGVARQLLSRATLLAKEKGLIACPYSRPAGFNKWLKKYARIEELIKGINKVNLNNYLKKYLSLKTEKGTCIDPVIGMHEYFGAKIERIFYNSRQDDESKNFCILMSYPKNHDILC